MKASICFAGTKFTPAELSGDMTLYSHLKIWVPLDTFTLLPFAKHRKMALVDFVTSNKNEPQDVSRFSLIPTSCHFLRLGSGMEIGIRPLLLCVMAYAQERRFFRTKEPSYTTKDEKRLQGTNWFSFGPQLREGSLALMLLKSAPLQSTWVMYLPSCRKTQHLRFKPNAF